MRTQSGCRAGVWLFTVLAVLSLSAGLASSDLCRTRCEKANTSLQRFRWAWSHNYNSFNGRELSFDEFMLSLISAVGKLSKLQYMREPLRKILGEYQDCLIACEHQFSKRGSVSLGGENLDPFWYLCEVLSNNLDELDLPILQRFWNFCLVHLRGA